MKRTVHKDYSHLDKFVSNLPAGLFAYTGLVMHDGRNCVKVLAEDGKKIVVKKFRKPNALNRVVYTFFRGSKAERAYNNALQLQKLGVGTPHPIGFVDVKAGGLLSSCYLATEYTDYEPIRNLIHGPERGNEVLFSCFVRFTVMLHEKGVRHDDYNVTNVLYKKREDGRYDFALIDVNRMKFGQMSMHDCISNIKRVCTNPEFTFQFAKKYAELRDWNVYRCVAGTSALRLMFERRRARKEYWKEWARKLAHA